MTINKAISRHNKLYIPISNYRIVDTTIQVKKKVKDDLEKLKLHNRESFNSVIERLVAGHTDSEPLSQDEIKDIEKGLEEVKGGKTYSLNEVKKKAGIK